MPQIKFQKQKISIENIGKFRFWIGVWAGVFTSILLSYLFIYFREVFRLTSTSTNNLLIVEQNENRIYNYFLTSLSSVLGLTISILIWMKNQHHYRKKDIIFKRLSITNLLLIFWIAILAFTRLATYSNFYLYGILSYENNINFFEDYKFLFLLIPLVLFLQNWLYVRLVYQSVKWILSSFISCLCLAFLLFLIVNFNTQKHDIIYNKRFEKDFKNIEQELKIANEIFGITFDKNTIEVLKSQSNENSFKQIKSIKKAFSKKMPVKLDTIILQKIVIKNNKKETEILHHLNSLENWHYALPIDIENQLKMTSKNSKEERALFEVLNEMILLINTPTLKYSKNIKYSLIEHRRSSTANRLLPHQILIQLIDVKKRIQNDQRFNHFSKKIIEINVISKR